MRVSTKHTSSLSSSDSINDRKQFSVERRPIVYCAKESLSLGGLGLTGSCTFDRSCYRSGFQHVSTALTVTTQTPTMPLRLR